MRLPSPVSNDQSGCKVRGPTPSRGLTWVSLRPDCGRRPRTESARNWTHTGLDVEEGLTIARENHGSLTSGAALFKNFISRLKFLLLVFGCWRVHRKTGMVNIRSLRTGS